MTAPSAPPGWYPDPSGSGKQRYWDGRSWTHFESKAPQNKRPKWAVPAVIGAVLLLIIIGSIDGNDDEKKDSASTSTPSTTARFVSPSTPSAAPAPPIAKIGQEVRDGKFAFVVTSVDRSTVAGDPSNPYMTETAQGEFINVYMTVRNIGDRPQTFFATNQRLITGGREYEADTMASVWSGGANEAINPGNRISAVVSFDVPPGTAPGVLEVHDSMFSGGAEIQLGGAPPASGGGWG